MAESAADRERSDSHCCPVRYPPPAYIGVTDIEKQNTYADSENTREIHNHSLPSVEPEKIAGYALFDFTVTVVKHWHQRNGIAEYIR